MRNILEMEVEESEGLIRDGRNRKVIMAPTASGNNTSRNNKASMLMGIAVAVAFFILIMASSGTKSANESSLPEDVELKDNVSSATASDGSKASTDTTTTTTPDKKNPLDLHEGFVYSKMATIVPDPYQRTIQQDTTAKKWGFWDGDETMRPDYDYTADFPFGDVPGDQFPDEAWQGDAVFVNHIVDAAANFIAQAKEAIFAEYGHGKPLPTEQLKERMKMFHWEKVTNLESEDATQPRNFAKRGTRGNGGWTTPRSWDGLVLRLLHACHTNRPFVIAMGGHSAAAGHGNHFHQSYMMQLHKVLAPVLGRLGVKLITRNLAQGGLGTLHNALGAGSIYGNDIDVLLWDSGMTEKASAHVELFMRQAILGGEKVPMLLGGHFDILRNMYIEVDADIGECGNGKDGIEPVVSEEQALTIPHAARYMICDPERQDLCDNQPKYCAVCWVERDDVPIDSFTNIKEQPGGQVKWHPGWKNHQLQGRVLAFTMLEALQEAVQHWSDGTMGGPPLDDDWWHVADYYKNIKEKTSKYTGGHCPNMADVLPERVCTVGLQARTQFTPRHDPENTSISSIIVPAADGWVPVNEQKEVYTGPDADNHCFELPKDAVDVLAIVSSGRRLLEDEPQQITPRTNSHLKPRHLAKGIVPGKGWQVVHEPAGRCDGEYYSICGRQASNDCPMLGHHDSRGVILGNEYSGWLVMEITNVSHGIIMLKLVTYESPADNTRTEGWTSVNNEGPPLEDRPEERGKGELADWLPANFEFEYAIDGKITTWDRAEFLQRHKQVQRVMEVVTLLDDPSFPKKDKIQVAFRMKQCGRACTFGLSHIYWA